MPGAPFGFNASSSQSTPVVSRPGAGATAGGGAGTSHNAFTVWVAVYALAAIAILGGLRVGGFSFVFRSR